MSDKKYCIENIYQKEAGLKSKYGHIQSNLYRRLDKDVTIIQYLENEHGILFSIKEMTRIQAYYFADDVEHIKDLLQQLDSKAMLSNLYKEKDDMESLFTKLGYQKYATYVRITTVYLKNPYSIPEEGARKILSEMYDPSMGEFPKEEDATEIYQVTKDNFDSNTDDVYTEEQWRQIIRDRNIIVYREQGVIIAYFAWRIEGKKLYGNMSLNLGTADILYSLERYVIEGAWEKGIHTIYAWYDIENSKALQRGNMKIHEIVKSQQFLYNSIWKRKDD